MWHEGALKVGDDIFHYWVKYFEEGSQWGIDGGRISKLAVKRDSEWVCNYERGWIKKPADENTEAALAILLEDYN